jgi:hypothetical protein
MKPPQHNPDLTKDTVMQLHLSPMNVSQQIKRLRTDEIITSPGGKSMAVKNRHLTLSCCHAVAPFSDERKPTNQKAENGRNHN